MGAVDVVPFIPIEGVTMEECVQLAQVGRRRRGVAVLAADLPLRRRRRRIRRARTSKTSGAASSKGLAAKMAQPAWAPDYGPAAPHPSGGATVIGARMPLIAYNINLATNRLDVAKKIAAAIRMSSGGLRYVKAMGIPLEDRGIVQVSMNLTNYEKTPIFRVFDLVKREAERYGVQRARERDRRAGAGGGAAAVGRVLPAARRILRRAGAREQAQVPPRGVIPNARSFL